MDNTALFYSPAVTAGALPMSAGPTPLAPPKSIINDCSIHNNPSPPCTPANPSLKQLLLVSQMQQNEGNNNPQASATGFAPPPPPPPLPHVHPSYPTPCLSHPQQQSTPACPPRVQVQQLCLPRDRHARPTMLPVSEGSISNQDTSTCSTSGTSQSSASVDPKMAKANFVDSLVDTATVVIESIWPPPPSTTSSASPQQKALPLRTFVQETLKRSRSSYSTLQTALYYLYKIRNKVPSEFLKRRNDQLYYNYQLLSAHTAGLATPPPSPLHLQQDTFPSTSSNAAVGASSSTDYFSLRNGGNHLQQSTLPSPTSTASNASMSPPESCDSTASPASSTSSSSDSTISTCSPSTLACNPTSSSPSQQLQQQQQQCNKILYCGRRTFLAALMVASKYLQDRNYSNKAWAKISGLSIKEINANELVFLKLIDYSLFVSHEMFMRWTALLLAHGQEATRRFMQSADAASAAAIAMRVRAHHQAHMHQQHGHSTSQQQQPLHGRPLSTRASSCLSGSMTTPTFNDTVAINSTKSDNLCQQQQQATPSKGDRGMMYWAAKHSRPDEQQLVQRRKLASASNIQQEYTMLPPHLALTPPDHADEAYPAKESCSSLPVTSHHSNRHISSATATMSAATTSTTATPFTRDTATTSAQADDINSAAVLQVDAHAGCKRRRDSDCLLESSNKSTKAFQAILDQQKQELLQEQEQDFVPTMQQQPLAIVGHS